MNFDDPIDAVREARLLAEQHIETYCIVSAGHGFGVVSLDEATDAHAVLETVSPADDGAESAIAKHRRNVRIAEKREEARQRLIHENPLRVAI